MSAVHPLRRPLPGADRSIHSIHSVRSARSVRSGVVAFAAACALLSAAAGSAVAAAPASQYPSPGCAPPGPPLSAAVARERHADGTSEATEFLARGEYRVTRCGRDGRFDVSDTVSPIIDPDGGITLVTTEHREPGFAVDMLYGDPTEPSWAANFRATRAERRAAIIPPTVPSPTPPAAVPSSLGPEPAGPAAPKKADGEDSKAADADGLTARAAVAGDACTNSQYTPWLGAWTSRNYGYYINRGRFDWNDNTVTSLVISHTNWDRTYNSCGLADVTNLSSWHLGSTATTIHTYADGLSVTDRGDMSAIGCPGALACTLIFTDGAGTITETDQRYNQDMTFSNVGAAGAYDYQSVGTHESGHSIGLTHANSSDALTMYYAVRAGTTYARSLARGDVMGLRAMYP
jgi:hypothetical protein